MKRRRLSRFQRIIKSSDFKEALKNGIIYRGRILNLGVAQNNYGISRIGISLRRKNFKLATQRNKIRRYLKEIFRLNKHDFKKGYDIIAMPKENCAQAKFNELMDEFLDILKRADILATS